MTTWFDVAGAAAYAGVSPATIKRAAQRGELVGYKVNGRRLWRFTPEDVDRWIMRSSAPVPFVVPARRGAA